MRRVLPVGVAVLVLSMAGCTEISAGDQAPSRIGPPTAVQCPRNSLTVYSGRVESWKRDSERSTIVIATEWGTREKVEIAGGVAQERKVFLLEGKPLPETEWQKRFAKVPSDQSDLKVNAWICSNPAVPPVLDWQVPPR